MLIKIDNLLNTLSLKQYFYMLLLVFLFISGTNWYITYNKVKVLEEEKENAVLNYRASNSTNRLLTLNIDDLRQSNDRKDKLVDSVKNVLKIKDKDLSQSIYIHDTLYVEAPVIIKDTIFVKDFKLDTIVGDKWLSNRLILGYPNKISLKTTVNNEKIVLISKKKEIKNTPSKYWIVRLFQRRIEYLKIDITNTNPYIKEVDNKTINYITK